MTRTTAPPVTVREVRPEERDDVATLLRRAYGAFADELPPDLLDRWLDDVVEPGDAVTLVGHIGGRLVGTARIHLDGSRTAALPPGSASVRAVAVDPDARRSGVATALMGECAAQARAAGATAVYLHTAPFMHAAAALYERLGYERDPAHDVDVAALYGISGPPVQAVISAYRLDLVPRCRVIRPGQGYAGRQGLTYAAGLSAESAGTRGLCLHTLTIPPGGRAKAHRHEAHESAIYVVRGKAVVWWGEGLAHRDEMEAGDFIYIPAGVPHLPINPGSEPAFAVVARTDPNEQESVVLMPELDDVPDRSTS
jgi:uncharacterized RmlC-like cupin family protein/ribosomal protein S18 acetylase RimI-like enzyme